MNVAFVRQLGAESGIQLNPLRDGSEIPAGDNSDQVFAIAMRATRGRIDKAFKVSRANAVKRLGKGEPLRSSELNEAYIHVREALDNGAYEVVVARLHTEAAQLRHIVVAEALDDAQQPTGALTFTVSDAEPEGAFLLSLRHLECFNDGIKVSLRADENKVGGVAQPNSVVTLRLLDPDGEKLMEFTGSLVRGAVDDSGNSFYLPDVIASRTDLLEVETGATESISPASEAYGYDSNFREKWATSPTMIYFVEGGTAYQVPDYIRARDQLAGTQHGFEYIASGGTKAPALLAQLARLSFDLNKQLRFDVPGNLNPEEAIAFVEQLNMGASETAHLLQAFWAPLKSNDPTGINPKSYIGTATLNIAKACGRNAQVNAKGFAPKNFPVAGREWPVNRTGIVQTYAPNSQELNALARAKINPVIYEVYTGGGRYVFRDSLTCAMVESSLKKLIAVADMSTSIDNAIARFGKDILQLPMKVALKRMDDFLRILFEGAQASDWIVPSSDPAMGGAAYRFSIRPNEQRPYDTMDVSYWVRYDGTNRAMFLTQTLTR